MKASISVISYNRKQLLNVFLLSLLSTVPRDAFELIVVDNHSTDGSVEYLTSVVETLEKFIPVKLFVNNWNKNLGPATNLAFDLANQTAEWLITYSEDDYLCPGWWENFMAFDNLHVGFLYTLLRPAFYATRERVTIGKANAIVNHDKVKIGCGLAVRREVIQALNYRFIERWPGRMGSPYTVFHRDMEQAGATYLEMDKPCGVTQNCEFNNPMFKSYYNEFFAHRGTEERLNRLRTKDGYWENIEDREYYYRGTGYKYEAGALANAEPLKKIVEAKFNIRWPQL